MTTIAEKLTQIAENTQRVYNAGYEKGIREGDGCDHNILPIVEIVPNFANGDFTESLPDNYYAHAAKILKPVNLKPENIAKDVNIAGVIGTHEGGGGSFEGTAKVTFCNYDGTELSYRLVFIGDDCPDPITQNKLDTPTRDSDVQYHYTFNGWSTTQGGTASSTALKNIKADKTVYAAFSTSLVYYTVRFYDGDTLMQESQVAYGETATPPSTAKEGYGFNGWTPSDLTIYGDTDFYGEWEETHVDANGQITDSWETIFANIENGKYKTYYNVGNYKPLDTGVDGVVNMQIVAFDLDVKSDGSGNAPITWIAKELLTTPMKHYSSTEYLTSWSDRSKVREYLCNAVMGNLPSEVQGAIVAVDKVTKHINTSTAATEIITTSETLWIPSAYELEGTSYENTGVHYTYTTTNPKAVYKKNSTSNQKKCASGSSEAVLWWSRTKYNKWDYQAWDTSGSCSRAIQSPGGDGYYICLCFCT